MKKAILIICLISFIRAGAQTFQWAQSAGGTLDEQSNGVATDAQGNIYTAGFFWGTADFDPGPSTFTLSSSGNTDIFVQKLDANGNFVWAVKMGSVADDQANAINVDPSGNVYITGYFSTTCDFDPGPGSYQLITPGGSYDAFVQKLTSNGALDWVVPLSGSGSEEGFGIHVDANGNVFSTGKFQGTADFNPGSGTASLTSAGSGDVYVSKLDNNGNYVWAKNLGGSGSDCGNAITSDMNGNILVSGSFEVIADFDPGIGSSTMTSSGLKDIFLCKLDATGNYTWAVQAGGTADDQGICVATDSNGDVYCGGDFSGVADFDPSATSTTNTIANGLTDFYIWKLSSAGSLSWLHAGGGALGDLTRNIQINGNELFVAGDFYGTVDFDFGNGTSNATASGIDVFLLKMDLNGSFAWVSHFSGGNEYCTGMTLDPSFNIISTGTFNAAGDFDPGAGTTTLTPAGGDDFFVHKINPVITTSINALTMEELRITPNPSEGDYTITFGTKKTAIVLEVRDVTGKTLLQTTVSDADKVTLELNQPPGVYFIVVSADGKSAMKKIIKS